RTLPLASLRVAVSCTVPPTYMLGAVGLTVTDATGTIATVTLAVPLFPSLVAVIVADPAATPVTSPAADTVAIAVFELVHATPRPVSTFPAASFGVALSCVVAPTKTFAVAGLTVTEATGTLDTVTAAVPACPSLVAVIVTAPTATPVTRPLAETVPTAPLPVVQVSARPLRTLPLASFRVAVSCTVPPAYMLGAVGLTVTDATGTFATVTLAVPLCPSLVAVIIADPAATPVTSPAADVHVGRGGADRHRRHRDDRHGDARRAALPLARRRDRRRPHCDARHQAARRDRGYSGATRRPGHRPAGQHVPVRVFDHRAEL